MFPHSNTVHALYNNAEFKRTEQKKVTTQVDSRTHTHCTVQNSTACERKRDKETERARDWQKDKVAGNKNETKKINIPICIVYITQHITLL